MSVATRHMLIISRKKFNRTEYPCFRSLLVDSSGLFTSNTLNLILSGISVPFTSLVQPTTTLVPQCLSLIVFAADALRNRPSFSPKCVAKSRGQQWSKHPESTISFGVFERMTGFTDSSLMSDWCAKSTALYCIRVMLHCRVWEARDLTLLALDMRRILTHHDCHIRFGIGSESHTCNLLFLVDLAFSFSLAFRHSSCSIVTDCPSLGCWTIMFQSTSPALSVSPTLFTCFAAPPPFNQHSLHVCPILPQLLHSPRSVSWLDLPYLHFFPSRCSCLFLFLCPCLWAFLCPCPFLGSLPLLVSLWTESTSIGSSSLSLSLKPLRAFRYWLIAWRISKKFAKDWLFSCRCVRNGSGALATRMARLIVSGTLSSSSNLESMLSTSPKLKFITLIKSVVSPCASLRFVPPLVPFFLVPVSWGVPRCCRARALFLLPHRLSGFSSLLDLMPLLSALSTAWHPSYPRSTSEQSPSHWTRLLLRWRLLACSAVQLRLPSSLSWHFLSSTDSQWLVFCWESLDRLSKSCHLFLEARQNLFWRHHCSGHSQVPEYTFSCKIPTRCRSTKEILQLRSATLQSVTSVTHTTQYCCGKVFETEMTQGLRAMSSAGKNRCYCLHNCATLAEMEVSLHNVMQLSRAYVETQQVVVVGSWDDRLFYLEPQLMSRDVSLAEYYSQLNCRETERPTNNSARERDCATLALASSWKH